ncbi:hypothetical protein B0T21DRAFT_37713 [Apiosordaria backusii]|uniref:Pesticidal crystal protein N-terminal domain-containing protein n=1 Tax=Apiosordaria backusii TaxID=314023 RepID=A0AA40B2T0_9PEZI|nr:hypothetical protein B0T21DRAFT_37713 [Apiosordaria backusii]
MFTLSSLRQDFTSHTASEEKQSIVIPDRRYVPSDPFSLDSIVDITKLLKSAVASGLKAIPEVGSLLASLFGVLWPDPKKPSLKWDQIESNVKGIVKDLLDKDKIAHLQQLTKALHDLIKEYEQTPFGISQKGERFTFILSWLTTIRREFTDNDTPWLALPFFVPLATLHLGFLREQLLHWDKIYPGEPADEDRLRRELTNAIVIYTIAADQIREKCLKWRLDERIVVTKPERDGWSLAGSSKCKYVRDLETKFSQTIGCGGPEFGPGKGYPTETEVDRYVQDLRDAAGAVYREQIDEILAPSLQWPQFDKAGTYDPVKRVVMAGTTGPMGSGISRGMWHFNDREFAREHGPITKVVVHGWDRVDGLEIWYGGVSSGLRGKRAGSSRELVVGEGESIVHVSGHIGKFLDSIRFSVSPKKEAQGGHGTDNFRIGFPEDGPENEPGTFRLDYVYGWSNGVTRGLSRALGQCFAGLRLWTVELKYSNNSL